MLGTVPRSHYVIPFSVGDIGLGAGFCNTQFKGDVILHRDYLAVLHDKG